MRARLLLAAVLAAATPALGQGFTPTRPIEAVVHTGPGGGSDLLARAIALMMEKEKLLPVRMQVVNKTGGGNAVAAAYLAEKKGDAHTIGLFTGIWLTSPLTSAEARVTLRDLTPVARLVLAPALIAVKADAPYRTLADFVNAAKQKPGELKQSGGTIGSRDNVVRQQLQKAGGARWQFISFPGGGERIAALLGGHVNMMVIEPADCLSWPGCCFAASMKSLRVLYGASFFTTSIAGSLTRPTSGVRSFIVTLASSRISGLVNHRPVYTAIVWVSPFFSVR